MLIKHLRMRRTIKFSLYFKNVNRSYVSKNKIPTIRKLHYFFRYLISLITTGYKLNKNINPDLELKQ